MINSTSLYLKENLRRIRLEKGFTQSKLSELAGISCDYLSEIERGKKSPSLNCLHDIAIALNIDTYVLLMPNN